MFHALTRPPGRDRNAARVIVAHAISRAGGTAAFFVGLWGTAAYRLDATPAQLAVLTAVIGAVALVGSAVSGVLVDRVGPKRVLIAAEALFVPSVLALATADAMASLTLLALPTWFLLSFVFTAIQSMPPFLVDDEGALERVNVRLEVAGNAAFVAGPALGAIIVRFLPLPAVFIFDAVTSLVAVALVVGLRIRAVDVRDRASGLRELTAGLAYAYGRPALRFVLVIATVTFLSFGAFTALEPLFFRDVVGTGPEAIGWVNAVFGIGTLLGAAGLDRLPGRLTSMRAIVALTAFGGAGALSYTATSDLRVIVVAALGWGAVLGALLPLIRTLLQLHAEPGYVGRVMGALGIQHQIGEMLPLAILPALAAAFGVQAVLAGTGVVLVVLAASAAGRARRLDLQLGTPDVAVEGPVAALAVPGGAVAVAGTDEREA